MVSSQEHYFDKNVSKTWTDSGTIEVKELGSEKRNSSIRKEDFSVSKLAKQCGLVYRETENTLINTGMQPFVVHLVIKDQK